MAFPRFKHQCYGLRTLILDLEDILLHWSECEIPALHCHSFHECTLSPTWGDLERGYINEKEALYTISQEIGVGQNTLQGVLQHRRKTLRLDIELYNQLRKLKAEMNGELRIYAKVNILEHDFDHLKRLFDNHDLFDGILTSFQAGMRKPETDFYHHVLNMIEFVDKEATIFVDGNSVNVIEARPLGLTGIVFKSPNQLMRQLRNSLLDPITRARQYMRANARNHVSCIESGPELRDNFSQFFIHHILRDTSVLNLSLVGSSVIEIEADIMEAATTAKLWNYFIGPPMGTTSTFPTDADDTAMALLAFSPPSSSTDIILDQLLANRCACRQLIQTYFCPQRPRVDPWVLANVLRVFYHYGRGGDVHPELEYVSRVLKTRAYVDGSSHYVTPEFFLYYCSSLVEENMQDEELQRLIQTELVEAVRERVGRRDDALAVAARIIVCQTVNVRAPSDIRYLKELQDLDGGWDMGWVCRFGRSAKRIGNRGVTTAFAVNAIERDKR